MAAQHTCDVDCVCPVHGTPLIYWPAGDDHACQDPTCEHAGGLGAGWRPPLFPDGIGHWLRLLADPGPSDGPPYVHTFRQPDPVPLLDGDGQPVVDEAGEPVVSWTQRPTHSLSHVTMPSMRDLVGPEAFGTPVLPPAFLPLETPSQRIARTLTDAGWTDAALRPTAEGIWYLTNRNPAPVVRRRPKSRKRKKT